MMDKTGKSFSHLKYTLGHPGGETLFLRQKKVSFNKISPLCVFMVLTMAAMPTMADSTLPTNGSITSGNASINTSGNNMTINQSTQNASINWHSFSVGSDASVNFVQPSSSSITLNRVTGSEKSIINGSVNANGQIFLLNSNGVLIGNGASISAGGVVASTMSMSDDDFNAGNYVLDNQNSTADVINRGTITATDGGYVVLAGQKVLNDGVIHARLGHAALASGEKVSLNFNGNSLVNVSVDKETVDALVENKQAIYADGGTVTMTAKAANKILENVVNNEGVIEARSISNKNGVIRLNGGDNGVVKNSGTLDASGKNSDETGGTIIVEGNILHQAGNAVVDASGKNGGGTILLGGDYQGSNSDIKNAAYNSIDKDVKINVDAIESGNGGKAIVWSDKNTYYNGSITAKGGDVSGDGGFVEVSGKEYLGYRGHVDTTAKNGNTGMLLLDPTDIVVLSGSGDSAADGSNTFMGNATAGTILAVDAGPSSIYESELEGIASGTNIALAASNSITFNAFADGLLNLAQVGGRSVTFTAGTGNITMTNLSDTIQTNGGSLSFVSTSGGATLGNLSTNGGLVFLNTGGASQISGIISGTGTALSKAGTGSLTLSGNNTYTGSSTLAAGNVTIGSNTAFGTGAVILTGSSIDGGGTARTLSNDIGLNANTIVSGTSALTFTGTITGNNNRSITNNISGGDLTLNNINISNTATSRTLTMAGTGNTTISGVIANGSTSPASALAKSGTGTLTLNGANTYAGASSLAGGTVIIGNNSAFGTGTVSLSGSLIQGDGTARTLNNNVSLAVASTISGTSDLTLNGALTNTGNLTLTNNIAGTLTLGNVNIANTATNRTLTIAGTGDTTVTGVIANGSTSTASALAKSGTGTLRLNNANTYDGLTTISAGTIRYGANDAIDSGAVTVNNGGTLDLNNFSDTIGALTVNSGASGATVTTGTGTLTLGGNISSTGAGTNALISGNLDLGGANRTVTTTNAADGLTISANISGAASLIKAGNGSLTLSGNNTHSVGTTLSAGTLIAGSNTAFGTGTLALNGGTLRGDGTARTLANAMTIGANMAIAGTSDLTFSGALTNTMAGNPVLTVSNTGQTTFGDINLSNTATSRTLSLSNTGNVTINGVIANGGGSTAGVLAKSGTGTLTLNGASTYGGGTTLSAGNTIIGNDGAFGSGGTLTLLGGSVQGNGTAKTISNNISVSANSTFGGSSDLDFTGTLTNTTAGNVTLNVNNTGTTQFGNMDLSNSASSRTVTMNNSGNVNINGVIANGGTATASAFLKSGTGILTLNNANTYDGLTTISAGTIRYGANDAIDGGAVTVNNGGTLDLNNFSDTIGALTVNSGASGATVSTGTGTLTLGGNISSTGGGTNALISGNLDLGGANRTVTTTNAADGLTISANISGAASLIKAGNGSLTLSGNNTHSVGTTLSAGTLIAGSNTAFGTGTLALNGGTLRGDGTARTLANDVQVNSTMNIAGTSDLGFTGTTQINSGNIISTNTGTTTFGDMNSAGTIYFDGTGDYVLNGDLNAGYEMWFDGTSDYTINGDALAGYNMFFDGAGDYDINGDMTASYEMWFQGNGTYDIDGNLSTPSGLVFDLTNDIVVDGNITTASYLNKNNANTLTLRGNNSYTHTNMNAGTLVVGSNTALGTGTLYINGGTISGDGTARTLANAINVNANMNIAGTSDLSFTGATQVNSGSIISTNTGTTTFGNINGNSSDMGFDGTGDFILDGNITSVDDLSFGGNGDVTLNGDAPISGSLYISGNGDYIINGDVISSSAAGDYIYINTPGDFTLNGNLSMGGGGGYGYVDFDGTGDRFLNGNITSAGGGGNYIEFGGSGDYIIGSASIINGQSYINFSGSGDATVDGVLTGNGQLYLNGTNVVTLNGNNTYTGSTSISSGTLRLGADNAISSTSDINVGSSATFDLDGYDVTANSLSNNGIVDFGSGSVFTTTGNQYHAFSATVNGHNTTLNSTTGHIEINNNYLSDFTGTLSGSAAGTFQVYDANDLTLGNVSALSIDARAMAGDITLNGLLNASDTSGISINLVASDDFINNAGVNALTTGAGSRWLTYSSSPLDDTTGGLVRDFKQYNAVHGDVILGAGNGSIYSVAPVVTAALTGTVTKPQDGTTTATIAPANYTLTGIIDGDTITTNTPAAGTYDTAATGTGKTVTATGLSILSATNGGATVYGYTLSSPNASGAVGVITSTTPPPTPTDNNTTPPAIENIVSVIEQNRASPLFVKIIRNIEGTTGTASLPRVDDLLNGLEKTSYELIYPQSAYHYLIENYITKIVYPDNRIIYKINDRYADRVNHTNFDAFARDGRL